MEILAEKIKRIVIQELQRVAGSRTPEALVKKMMREVQKEPDREPLEDSTTDAYFGVQQLSSIFAEGMSSLPALKQYEKIVGDASVKYDPRGLPASSLTGSYFTTWAFYDFRINKTGESIGSIQIELTGLYPYTELDCEVLRNQIAGRMDIYEHCDKKRGLIQLRELLTEKEFSYDCVAGYPGTKGELWYVRLCNPLSIDPDGPFIAMTTPYILIDSTKKDWEDFLRRTLSKVKPVSGEDAMHCLLYRVRLKIPEDTKREAGFPKVIRRAHRKIQLV